MGAVGRFSGLGFIGTVLLGVYLQFTSPPDVTPMNVPADSPLNNIPPWPVFRVAVALNELFQWLAVVTTPPNVAVINKATAYWESEVLYALAKNGVFDAIGSDSLLAIQIAKKTETNSEVLTRYLDAGVKVGVLKMNKEAQKGYELTAQGSLLQKDVPGSLNAFALMINEESMKGFRAAGIDSIKDKEPVSGFKNAFGEEFWSYLSKHPEKEALFASAMTSFSQSETAAILKTWAPTKEDFTFCDVGGGHGFVLATVLEHYPKSNGVLIDLPANAEHAEALFASRNLTDRATALGGDFFQPLPKEQLAECDVYFMKHILHDWNDDASVKILSNIRESMRPGSKLLNCDFVIGGSSMPSMEKAKHLMDINMLQACGYGAKERSVSEFAELFKNAGFNKEMQLLPLRDLVSLLEVPV